MRICSLLPSATEIAYAIGLGDSIVGVSHECDFPPEATTKPSLLRLRIDPKTPPAEIDRQVGKIIARGESIYAVDAELLRSLSPDLILTQDLCHVCAASPDDLATSLTRFSNPPAVLSLTPRSLSEVWSDIRRVGEATGSKAKSDALANELARRVDTVTAKTSHVTARPRALCLEWLDPFYVGGHWVPEMVWKAGGEDVLGRANEPSFRVTPEQVADSNADVIVVMPCGYNTARASGEIHEMRMPDSWKALPAVRNGRLFAVNANALFSRPGPRLADGVELLAHLFHADLFDWSGTNQAYCRL